MAHTPKQYYRIVHDWLHKHYGKPSFCSNINCDNKGKRYEYALIHGKKYERNINNYIQLCSKCHRNYDLTDDKKKKMAKRIAGKFNENLKFGPMASMKKVILVDEGRLFNSQKELAEYLGCDASSIAGVLSGRRKSIYGHKIKLCS